MKHLLLQDLCLASVFPLQCGVARVSQEVSDRPRENFDSAGSCLSFRKSQLGDSHSEAVNVEVCVWLPETVTCVAFIPGE